MYSHVCRFAYYGQIKLGLTTYDRPFVALVIISYILKDRIKVWGQRYYGFLVKKIGLMVPDHTIVLADILGHRVGIVEEECGQATSSSAPAEIVKLRNGHLPEDARLVYGKMAREKVVVYKKAITLNWDSIERTIQEVSAVSDRTRIDLSPLLQRAEAPTESHYLLVDRPRPAQAQLAAGEASGGLASPPGPLGSQSGSGSLPLPAGAESGNGGGSALASTSSIGPTREAHVHGAPLPASVTSESVTVKKVACPRTYECVFVIKVRRRHTLGDKLRESIQSGAARLIQSLIGQGPKRLTRALSSILARGGGSAGDLFSDATVEVHKVFCVTMDRNGVRRIVEREVGRSSADPAATESLDVDS